MITFNNEEQDDENSASPDISNAAIGTFAADKGEQEFCVMSKSKKKSKKVRLQNEVSTQWNSSLQMINSLLYLHKEISNALKQTSHNDMCLRDNDLSLLQKRQNCLQSFAQMTDLVSSGLTSLSLIPLIRAEIVDTC